MAKRKQRESTPTPDDVKWYVMRGFMHDDGEAKFLALRAEHRRTSYTFVDDIHDAMKFPSHNVSGASGFGTPKQWLEFFRGEDELSGWKIHLMRVASPKQGALS